ncbi:MAG: hypothetical protein J1E63_09335 [Muribaculaceae bacterium]|nr:hypothetical protein [Muribaculaceae bacterium]
MKSLKRIINTLTITTAIAAIVLTACGNHGDTPADRIIYSCDAYTVTSDSVIQGDFVAKALSPTEIVTNYRSSETSGASPLVNFRFSLNSRDNEPTAGRSHVAVITPGVDNDTIYGFGVIGDEPVGSSVAGDTLPVNTPWTVRLDMRPVLRSFDRHGYYVAAAGDTIFADDFKGVWIAGSVDPLNWDFENLYGKHDRRLEDRGDSIFEVTLTVNPPVASRPDPTGWRVDSVNTAFPRYSSDQLLVDALYNMSIDELHSNLRPDGAYRAGREWDGVWTRDVSYSIYLALAYLDPIGSMNSLRAKVKNGRIVQDTGTGGAWPVSTDREVWALAAWEIYTVTGDKKWLSEAFDIIGRSLDDDLAVAWNPLTRLMHGEQSYLDWREQTYPRWMQPADIFESMCLGTNVVFTRAFDVMALMAAELGHDPAEYSLMASTMRDAINDLLWIPDKGYYSEYLYGSVYPIQSQATDNLGQSLAILFDVARPEMATSVISRTPQGTFGTPSVFPQMADIRPYHNDACWPFVQAYWNLAAAKTGNMTALNAGLGAIYRAAALFATNKELFVHSTGDYRGTAVNSDAQLWSCAGQLAMTFRVIAGMTFEPTGIKFKPVVPAALTGDKKITDFKYRNATLDITVSGTGTQIASFTLDGKETAPLLPADIQGHHSIIITMTHPVDLPDPGKITILPSTFMPPTPVVTWSADNLVARIENHSPGTTYNLLINGTIHNTFDTDTFRLDRPAAFETVAFVPLSKEGVAGFSMRPRFEIPQGAITIIPAASIARGGTSLIKDKKKAERFVELTVNRNTRLRFEFEAPEDGTYLVDVRYANGSGPINTENKCAIRTLTVNNERAGAIVMPQRGTDEWLSTGFSNMIPVRLKKGTNSMAIEYLRPSNVNMNGEVNTALIDYIRVIRQ